MIQLTAAIASLYWLPAVGPVLLKKKIYLVGQDGWADGRYGDYLQSPVELNDSRLIIDLFLKQSMGKKQLLEQMQQLADADAQQLKNKLSEATALGHSK